MNPCARSNGIIAKRFWIVYVRSMMRKDRLMDGGYGLCVDCGQRIGARRLLADPAVSLCLTCQGLAEVGTFARTL